VDEHHASLSSDHADLLNFRTGFVERQFKPKGTHKETTEEGGKAEDHGAKDGAKVEHKAESPKEKIGKEKGKSHKSRDREREPKVKLNFEDESAFPKLA